VSTILFLATYNNKKVVLVTPIFMSLGHRLALYDDEQMRDLSARVQSAGPGGGPRPSMTIAPIHTLLLRIHSYHYSYKNKAVRILQIHIFCSKFIDCSERHILLGLAKQQRCAKIALSRR
jgi:hypothetical protein